MALRDVGNVARSTSFYYAFAMPTGDSGRIGNGCAVSAARSLINTQRYYATPATFNIAPRLETFIGSLPKVANTDS